MKNVVKRRIVSWLFHYVVPRRRVVGKGNPDDGPPPIGENRDELRWRFMHLVVDVDFCNNEDTFIRCLHLQRYPFSQKRRMYLLEKVPEQSTQDFSLQNFNTTQIINKKST